MTQRLHCSYGELMEMPEDLYDLFQAFMRGEGRAQAAKRARASVTAPEGRG